jgi:NAD(P)-dependent dehydrogenase (short-subunit alcohol dehydrogenase family)
MNIVIVGCGNIGFETAERLCNEHNLLLINRSCSEDLAQLVRNHDNVWFESADAANQSGIEAILNKFKGIFKTVDVLICTVGAFCPTSALDDIERFKEEFYLNFFGNLVPIQAILRRMLPAGAGRIIVVSSTSGVFTYPGLTAYTPAKWALTNFCLNLRDKLKGQGISVDILFPSSIRNRRSRTFLYKKGIESEKVTSQIVRILKGKHNVNRFIPKRYALLHTLERVFPRFLDRRAGLNGKRNKLFRAQKTNSVLISGTSSELGKELAINYSKTAKRLYLLGSNEQALSELKRELVSSSDCLVDKVCLDPADFQSIASFADSIEHVELIINNIELSTPNQASEDPVIGFDKHLKNNLFGAIHLVAAFMRKKIPPVKIVHVLPVTVAEDRTRCDCHSASRAALWAFTRSLRRTFGHRIQVMEVILVKLQGMHLTARMLAQRIHELEKQGREIVVLPLRYKLSMYLSALLPWRLG